MRRLMIVRTSVGTCENVLTQGASASEGHAYAYHLAHANWLGLGVRRQGEGGPWTSTGAAPYGNRDNMNMRSRTQDGGDGMTRRALSIQSVIRCWPFVPASVHVFPICMMLVRSVGLALG